jgi:hypothetical protein
VTQKVFEQDLETEGQLRNVVLPTEFFQAVIAVFLAVDCEAGGG